MWGKFPEYLKEPLRVVPLTEKMLKLVKIVDNIIQAEERCGIRATGRITLCGYTPEEFDLVNSGGPCQVMGREVVFKEGK